MGLLGPVTLTGNHVRLEPMRPVHAAALLEAGRSTEIWAWMPARPLTAQTMDRWLEKALQAEAQGREYPFVVVCLGRLSLSASVAICPVRHNQSRRWGRHCHVAHGGADLNYGILNSTSL